VRIFFLGWIFGLSHNLLVPTLFSQSFPPSPGPPPRGTFRNTTPTQKTGFLATDGLGPIEEVGPTINIDKIVFFAKRVCISNSPRIQRPYPLLLSLVDRSIPFKYFPPLLSIGYSIWFLGGCLFFCLIPGGPPPSPPRWTPQKKLEATLETPKNDFRCMCFVCSFAMTHC